MGDRFEAAYVIAGTLGLRRGEVIGLRWSDIDIYSGVLHVRQQVQRVGGKDRITPLETKRRERALPLTRNVHEALDRRRERQAEEAHPAGDRWQESGLSFTSIIGTMMNQGNFHAIYRIALKIAGLDGHAFHAIRYTASTMLVGQGVHPRAAMEILGRSSISVTMDVSSHIVGDSMRDALAWMEELLEGER